MSIPDRRGAILAFATNLDVSGVDMDMVGIILMIAGSVGLLLFLLVFGPRSRARTESVETPGGAATRRTIVEE